VNTIIILLYLLSFLIIWQFVGYPTFMCIVGLTAKPQNKDYSFQPFISVIVPTYNEENVIENRIENLLELDYPKDKYEIVVVDSASTDKTVEIVNNIIKKQNDHEPCIKLIEEEERRGKASAINIGKKHIKGEIALVTDANSLFDKNVLKEIAPYFKDPKIGAVGGRFVVKDPKNSIENSTQFYWDIEYIVRMGESSLDSACLFHGEINAWRKDIVEADEKSLSEDLDMVLKIKKQGYKIQYEPKAIVYEPAASNVTDQIKQRKRTSIGTIQNMFKHWRYLIIPADFYRAVIFPSHKSIVMFSPFLFIAVFVLYIASADISMVITHFLITLCVFSILLAILVLLMTKVSNSDIRTGKANFSLKSVPKIFHYVLLNEYLILLAWKDYLFGTYSVLWEKAETTRT